MAIQIEKQADDIGNSDEIIEIRRAQKNQTKLSKNTKGSLEDMTPLSYLNNHGNVIMTCPHGHLFDLRHYGIRRDDGKVYPEVNCPRITDGQKCDFAGVNIQLQDWEGY